MCSAVKKRYSKAIFHQITAHNKLSIRPKYLRNEVFPRMVFGIVIAME